MIDWEFPFEIYTDEDLRISQTHCLREIEKLRDELAKLPLRPQNMVLTVERLLDKVQKSIVIDRVLKMRQNLRAFDREQK